MVTTRAPWTERLLQLLEESPRPREWLIQETMGLVPAGRAWRMREKNRLEKGPSDTNKRQDFDTGVPVGQRRVISLSITHFMRRGRIAGYVDPETGTYMLRIARPPHVRSRAEASRIAKKGWETSRKAGKYESRVEASMKSLDKALQARNLDARKK